MNENQKPEMKVYALPKTADFDAFQCDIHFGDGKVFSLTAKIKGGDMASAVANGVVSSKKEGLEKLRTFCMQEAIRIFESNKITESSSKSIWFSLFW